MNPIASYKSMVSVSIAIAATVVLTACNDGRVSSADDATKPAWQARGSTDAFGDREKQMYNPANTIAAIDPHTKRAERSINPGILAYGVESDQASKDGRPAEVLENLANPFNNPNYTDTDSANASTDLTKEQSNRDEAAQHALDNTGANIRDRNVDQVTPMH